MADSGKEILVLGLVGVGAYLLYNWWQGQQTAVAGGTVQAPGTTQPGQTTTISTAPPSTVTPAPGPPGVPQPTATDLQNILNKTTGSADDWNYAYRQRTGYGIEQVYGFDFDKVYGPVVNGVRSTGTITADAFLQAPARFGFQPLSTMKPLSGFGAIAILPGLQQSYQQQIIPYFRTQSGELLYRAHWFRQLVSKKHYWRDNGSAAIAFYEV